jgi:hypothetical protein
MPDKFLVQATLDVFVAIFTDGLSALPAQKLFGGILVLVGILGILFIVRKPLISEFRGLNRGFKIPRPWALLGVLGAIVIGTTLGGVGGEWLISKLAQSPNLPDLQDTTSTKAQSFIEVTPASLIRVLRSHTDYQGQKLVHQYMGRWMKVEGQVKDVGALHNYAIVILYGDNSINPPYFIGLVFNKDWLDRASSLAIGDSIVASGQIYAMDSDTIKLSGCEFQFDEK